MNIRPQSLSIKNLAQKAESLGHTVGKGIAKNKFGSRTVLNAAKMMAQKAKDIKANLLSSDKTNSFKNQRKTASQSSSQRNPKPSNEIKVTQITPEIAGSTKDSGLL
jgi:hypothetical protein